MATKEYQPPKQSMSGQVIDSLFLLILVVASLFVPVYLGLAGGGKTALTFAAKTWEAMGQNATMQAIWEKLGFTPDSAADIIASRFDYSFNWLELLITAVVLIAYFAFIVRYSEKEYQEVIAERFGNGPGVAIPPIAPVVPAAAIDAVSDDHKPALLAAPRGDGPDDLKLIWGVGPKLEEMLHGMGVFHFDQIEAWTETNLNWVDQNLGTFRGRAVRDDWIGQARKLASGWRPENSVGDRPVS